MLDNSRPTDVDKKPVRVKLGGLWQYKTKKDGIAFLSGSLGYGAQIQVWPNRKREGKNDPDYQIFIVEKDEDQRNYNKGQNQQDQEQINPFPANDAAPKNLDEMPF